MIPPYRRTGNGNRAAGLTGTLVLHVLMLIGLLLATPITLPPAVRDAVMVRLWNLAPPRERAAVTTHKSAPVRAKAVKPRGIPDAPQDIMEARMKILALLRAPDAGVGVPDGGAGGSGDNYALADYVRAAILRRWWPQLESGAARAMSVVIKLTLSRDGVISNVRIAEAERMENDRAFHNMVVSARNAALMASPIAMPPGRYPALMEVSLTLDPNDALK